MNRAPLYTPEQHEREHFRFVVKRRDECCTVTVFSRLNALNGPPLRDRLKMEIDEGAQWITLDLTDVDEIEKAQFGALLSVARYVRRTLGAVTILNAKPHVLAGFRQWGVASAFTFATSEVTP